MKKIVMGAIFVIMLTLIPVASGVVESRSSSSASAATGGMASATTKATSSGSASIWSSVNAYAGQGILGIDITIGNPGERPENLIIEFMVDSEPAEKRSIILHPKESINLSFSWQAEEGSHTVSYRILDEEGLELAYGTQTVSVLPKQESAEISKLPSEEATQKATEEALSRPQKVAGVADIIESLVTFFSYIFGFWR